MTRGRKSTLSAADVQAARALRSGDKATWTLKRLAEEFGVSPMTVFRALRGRREGPPPRRYVRRRPELAAAAEGRKAVPRLGPEPLGRAEIERRRAARAPAADDLTARLMGDPPPGESALAQRNSGATRSEAGRGQPGPAPRPLGASSLEQGRNSLAGVFPQGGAPAGFRGRA